MVYYVFFCLAIAFHRWQNLCKVSVDSSSSPDSAVFPGKLSWGRRKNNVISFCRDREMSLALPSQITDYKCMPSLRAIVTLRTGLVFSSFLNPPPPPSWLTGTTWHGCSLPCLLLFSSYTNRGCFPWLGELCWIVPFQSIGALRQHHVSLSIVETIEGELSHIWFVLLNLTLICLLLRSSTNKLSSSSFNCVNGPIPLSSPPLRNTCCLSACVYPFSLFSSSLSPLLPI